MCLRPLLSSARAAPLAAPLLVPLANPRCLCPPHTSSILLPLPSYFNHAMSLSLQSVDPAYLPCDPASGFAPSIDAARAILAAGPQIKKDASGERKVHPRAIVLVTPNNPTGSTYSPERLKEWLELAREYGVPLILDETYRDFAGEGGAPHGLFGEEGWRDSLITLGSFSSESAWCVACVSGLPGLREDHNAAIAHLSHCSLPQPLPRPLSRARSRR